MTEEELDTYYKTVLDIVSLAGKVRTPTRMKKQIIMYFFRLCSSDFVMHDERERGRVNISRLLLSVFRWLLKVFQSQNALKRKLVQLI